MNTFDFPESDDLDDAINAPARDVAGDMGRLPTTRHSKIDREVFGVNRAHAHKENCPKCRGTGRFRSYTGHDLGSCFHCKGEGFKYYAHSAEDRARTRQQVANRKARKLLEALEAFQAEHPAIWAWMNENLTSDRPFEFAVKMHTALVQYGSLTGPQLAACQKSVARITEIRAQRAVENEARAQAAPEVTSSALVEAFRKAQSAGLKWPKLHLQGYQISMAGAASKNPGALYVKAGETYLGKIQDGRFFHSRDCDDAKRALVCEVINDPAKAVRTSGLQTGTCSCCGRELTNPTSIEAGIGPICASRWGF